MVGCIFPFCNCPITPNALLGAIDKFIAGYADFPSLISSQAYNVTAGVLERIAVFQYAPMLLLALAVIWLLWYFGLWGIWPAIIASIIALAFIYAFAIGYQSQLSSFLNSSLTQAEDTLSEEFQKRLPTVTGAALVAYLQGLSTATIKCPPPGDDVRGLNMTQLMGSPCFNCGGAEEQVTSVIDELDA